jgi:Xaa-Pro dipeptidase
MPENSDRIGDLQRAMKELGVAAMLLEPGPAMLTLTGVRWGRSERTFALVVTRSGKPAFVLPAFEEARAREVIPAGAEIHLWQEDENPFAKIAEVLAARGISSGRIGLEETVRFFVFDGLRRKLPKLKYVDAGLVPGDTGTLRRF